MHARRFLSQGYLVQFGRPFENSLSHTFCGPCTTPGAICPNCRRPLLQFLRLDCRDPRLSLPTLPGGYLPLLFCWRCNLAQAPFAYRIVAGGEADLISCKRGRPNDDFPYSDYPDAFPEAAVELFPLTEAQQRLISEINRGGSPRLVLAENYKMDVPRHQIGGEPYLVQPGAGGLDCPRCNAALPFLAAIADATADSRGFTGNEYVQVLFFFCADCAVVAAYQTCD